LRGEPPIKNALSGGINGIEAGRSRELEWASDCQWPARKGLTWTVVQAGSGEERMVAQKIRFPAWRTAEIGEKFGINAPAFKAAFSA
jgi:hypothetical protein